MAAHGRKDGRPRKRRRQRYMAGRKPRRAVSGYDIILGASELSCTAEWFVAECRRRMAAAGAIAGRVPDVSDSSRAAA